jgi:hypothetical protein
MFYIVITDISLLFSQYNESMKRSGKVIRQKVHVTVCMYVSESKYQYI